MTRAIEQLSPRFLADISVSIFAHADEDVDLGMYQKLCELIIYRRTQAMSLSIQNLITPPDRPLRDDATRTYYWCQ